MKKLFLIIPVIFLTHFSYAQNFRIGLNTGYGTYQMNDLQQLQANEAYNLSQFHVEQVQRFPGYINYSASIDYFFNSKNLAGIHTAYYTTGGRNHVKDYSGEYYLNMPVNSWNLGLQYKYIFLNDHKLSYYLRLKGGISFSTLDIEESLTIHQVDSVTNNYAFAATSFYAEPSLGVYYTLGHNFSVNFSAGYQIDIPGALHEKGNKGNIMGSSSSHIHCNWSGIRIEAGIAYDIFRKQTGDKKSEL